MAVTKTSTLGPKQKPILPLLISKMFDGKIPASVIANTKKFRQLLKSGELDDLLPSRDDSVFKGDRVADLTDTQKKIIGSSGGLADTIRGGTTTNANIDTLLQKRGLAPAERLAGPITSGPFVPSEIEVPETVGSEFDDESKPLLDLFKQLIEEKTLKLQDKAEIKLGKVEDQRIRREERNPELSRLQPAEVVGEQGPEVITATQPSTVLPNVQAPVAQSFNPLGQVALGAGPTIAAPAIIEQNQVGADPAALLAETQLPGLASGGELLPGQSAVVGEQGPEVVQPQPTQTATAATPSLIPQANDPLRNDQVNATQRHLSGDPSTTVNTGTTDKLIQNAVANPARKNFAENTSQTINSAFAGPGFFGSARGKALQKGAQDVEDSILSQGSQLRYQDEQARRGLAESAANRSLSAINPSLAVSNNPLAQGQATANIGATQAGTEAQKFDTEANKSLLPGELEQQSANVQQSLANIGLTDVQTERFGGLIEQDMARTGQIDAQTEDIMRREGVTDAQIEQIKSNTANTDADLVRKANDAQIQQQQARSNQIRNLMDTLGLASVGQAQNQAEINAIMQEFGEVNPDMYNELMGLLGIQTQSAIVTQEGPGVASSVIAGGISGAAAAGGLGAIAGGVAGGLAAENK